MLVVSKVVWMETQRDSSTEATKVVWKVEQKVYQMVGAMVVGRAPWRDWWTESSLVADSGYGKVVELVVRTVS